MFYLRTLRDTGWEQLGYQQYSAQADEPNIHYYVYSIPLSLEL